MSQYNNISIDGLILTAMSNNQEEPYLMTLFKDKIKKLDISFNQAAVNMEVDNKALDRILAGKTFTFDLIIIPKLAAFLECTPAFVAERLVIWLSQKRFEELEPVLNRCYVLNTLDTSLLKKIKFIDSISDVSRIEQRVSTFLGLQSIRDFKNKNLSIAYSSGVRESKSQFSKLFWIRTAQACLEHISNPHPYRRDDLMEYIPSIRWHSVDVFKGLGQVVQSLFKLGITVIYIPPVKDGHVRGATFAWKEKPCIVITDYTDFYPSLWFTLMHEIFHVLFQWDEILSDEYHITEESEQYLQNEVEANEFAREFFVTETDMREFVAMKDDKASIAQLSLKNTVHPSFYYIFYAYANTKKDPSIWSKVRRHNPAIEDALAPLIPFGWETEYSIEQISKIRNQKLYNL